MNNRIAFISLVVALWLFVGENAQAQSGATLDWYVATFGSNDNDCRTPKTPCADINTVLALPDFSPNDVILAEGANFYYTGEQEIAIYIDKAVTISGGWSADFTYPLTRPTSFIGYEHIGIQIESGTVVTLNRVVATGGAYDPSLILAEEELFAMLGNKGGIINYGNLTLDEGYGYGYYGFGIKNLGVMTFTNSVASAFNDSAIYNEGSLTMDKGQVESVQTEVGCGGVLNTGTLVAESSFITGNKSGYGDGGLCNFGTAIFTNSVIGGNISTDKEQTAVGGISNYGTVTLINTAMVNNYGYYIRDIYNEGEMYFANVTFARTMWNDPRDSIVNEGNGTIHSRNSIIHYCRGGIQSDGYNLLADSEGCDWQAATGDILDRDPLLDAALVPRTNSPALNSGNPNGCLAWDGTPLDTDVHGNPRWRECDIGAYEYIPPAGEIFYQHLPLIQRIPE